MITDYLTKLNAELFPLRKFRLNDPKSKTPLHKGWRTREYSQEQLEAYAADGHAIGWRLGPYDLVIDIDVATDQRPDKQGDESFRNLLVDIGVDIQSLEVVSPSGGRHLYLMNPNAIKLRKKLKQYPGIEFIGPGGYVVIAGSPHWQGGQYAFDDNAGRTRSIAPTELIELLEYRPAEVEPGDEVELSPEELKNVLSQIDARDYADNESWYPLLASAHHATGGAGFDVFADWSTADPDYADDRDVILSRWESLNGHCENPITGGTLLAEVRDSGGSIALGPRSTAEADFEPIDEDGKPKRSERFPVYWGGGELENLDAEVTFLCDGVLVRGEPMIVGGPEKSFKTTLLLDLALSLANGAPFLGSFAVPEPTKVLFMSGETSIPTVKRNALSIARHKGLKSLGRNFGFSPAVPYIDKPKELRQLKPLLKGVDVLVIDPSYFAISADQSSLNAIGAVLREFSRFCTDADVTPILAHHAVKSARSQREKPITLSDLTGAGYGAFAAQWILINARSDFEPVGPAELWLSIGARSFAGRDVQVDLDEGKDPADALRYDYRVKVLADSAAAVPPEFDSTLAGEILKAIEADPDNSLSLRAIAELVGIDYRNQKLKEALRKLIAEKQIVSILGKKGKRQDRVVYELADFEGAELF